MADKKKKDSDSKEKELENATELDIDEDEDLEDPEAEEGSKDSKKYDKNSKAGKSAKASVASGKRQVPAKKKGKSFGKRIVKYGRDLKGEFKKIIWPTIPQTVRSTLVTISMCIVVGIFIILIDAGLGKVIDLLTGLKG